MVRNYPAFLKSLRKRISSSRTKKKRLYIFPDRLTFSATPVPSIAGSGWDMNRNKKKIQQVIAFMAEYGVLIYSLNLSLHWFADRDIPNNMKENRFV